MEVLKNEVEHIRKDLDEAKTILSTFKHDQSKTNGRFGSRLQDVENKSDNNKSSIDKVEASIGTVMTTLMEMQKKPAKRWEHLTTTVITVIVTSIVTAIITMIINGNV